MGSDTVKLLLSHGTAAIITIGSLVLAVYVWSQPPVEGRDLALVYGLIGTAFGAGSSFLFMQEASLRASRAAESAHTAGAYAGVMSPVGYTLQPEPAEDYVGEDGDLADDGTPDVEPIRPTPVP
jgi:hypothetical protein